jgi:hypothetical protein
LKLYVLAYTPDKIGASKKNKQIPMLLISKAIVRLLNA